MQGTWRTSMGKRARTAVRNVVEWTCEVPLSLKIIVVLGIVSSAVWGWRKRDIKEWVEFTGLIVAVLAAILACWETRHAAARLASFLATKRIAEFPGCIPRVVELIRKAKKGDSLYVLCDVPGYAVWSSHELYLEYLAGIKTASAAGALVRMIIGSQDRRSKVIREQFSREFWNKDGQLVPQRSSGFVTKQKAFNLVAAHDMHCNIEHPDWNYFCNFILDWQEKARCDLPSAPLEVDWPMPLSLWILDSGEGTREAVFSVTEYKTEREVAFWTDAQDLVASLIGIWASFDDIANLRLPKPIDRKHVVPNSSAARIDHS